MGNKSVETSVEKLKKYIILLAVVFMVVQVADAKAATAHSQAEAVNWANAQIGKGLDYDKMYGNLCNGKCKCIYYKYTSGGLAEGVW